MSDHHPSNYCRICGYDFEEPPWGESGEDPTWIICDCCGCEAGYEDCGIELIQSYREYWIAKGMQWFNPKRKPENWSLEKQMKNIPPEFI